MRLDGRVVAVTGAFGFLGRAVCARLSALGAQVVAIDRVATPAGFAAALALGDVDLTSSDAARAAFAHAKQALARLDALVNLAGGFRWETLGAGDPATWDLLFQMNLRTAVTACHAALPLLRDGGRIVNVGAAAAAKAAAGMGAYAASKAGVARLTEALAEELKDKGVTVNAVLPSILDTPANRADMPDADFSRWVAPDALADVIAFLLSDASRAVTGALIPVTGRV
jgi:NAD(P)-dependent dehydrogenase (short-subunit alcohol dehydrogenase family)